ncbi:MAG: Gfo/Idh/MocA family oxidoreductase [Lentisphaeria bacterium]|nr:Gfo/Idh/MocA family oxidoreductase [Lentisphaeria bacterium]
MADLFNTDKRIRLGIWGLGRGSAFIKAARELNIDVVAGCDVNPVMRDAFRKECPEAFITDDENEFLNYKDMDAVLIATFFMDHAKHTIRTLEAGFHVMCEVTSFYTPAEGVKVVEAVEKSGKVYNLLENYPFTKENMYLAKLYKDGFFGEFQYAEFEYLHDCRSLCYCYNMPGAPTVEPGYTAHSWRSWLNFHYYNTHSLGPLMRITGLRPEYISAFPEAIPLPGFLPGSGMSKPCPSLIKMSNGGIMRNMCGATTGNYHNGKRFWGTRASAESLDHGLRMRIGATGEGMRTIVEPQWPELAELAENAGHGGGDFWELYYFAREILTGEKAPWDIYNACDVTLAGIMAARSTDNNGAPMEIPDFRKAEVREKYRSDNYCWQQPFDPDKIFPDGHDTAITSNFNKAIYNIGKNSILLRKAMDGAVLYPNIINAAEKLEVIKNLNAASAVLDELENYRNMADKIINAYPDSLAAEALRSMKTLSEPEMNDGAEILAEKIRETIKKLLEADNK